MTLTLKLWKRLEEARQNFIGFIKYLRATYPELDILPLGAGAA
jgi:hypothetical protein